MSIACNEPPSDPSSVLYALLGLLVDPPFSLLSLSLSLSLPLVLGITHWCYNPLVLRRRTCYPVSNTLFFLSGFISLRHPYAHFAAVWSPGDRRAPIVESVMPKQEILRRSSGVDGPSRARLNIGSFVFPFFVRNRHRCIYREYDEYHTCRFLVLPMLSNPSILHPLPLAGNSRTNFRLFKIPKYLKIKWRISAIWSFLVVREVIRMTKMAPSSNLNSVFHNIV